MAMEEGPYLENFQKIKHSLPCIHFEPIAEYTTDGRRDSSLLLRPAHTATTALVF